MDGGVLALMLELMLCFLGFPDHSLLPRKDVAMQKQWVGMAVALKK